MYKLNIQKQEHMTNSLLKDSHITQSLWHPQTMYSGGGLNKGAGTGVNKNKSQSERKEYLGATVNNSIGTSVRKPAEINFCGLSGAKLANDEEFQKIMAKVKESLGSNINLKNFKSFVSDVVDVANGIKNDASANIKEFVNSNKNNIDSFIKNAQNWVKEENDIPLQPKDFDKEVKNIINNAVEGASALDNDAKKRSIYTNKTLKWLLGQANDSQPVFNALFSILLTCILRPASIMALPGDKKNKDDKKYAAAHSVASGIIAYLMALAIFNPLSGGMRKVAKNSQKFIKNKASYLLKDKKAMDIVSTYVKMLPETFLAAPRAMLTVALIPPILKYVFGWEKKSDLAKKNESKISVNNGGVK